METPINGQAKTWRSKNRWWSSEALFIGRKVPPLNGLKYQRAHALRGATWNRLHEKKLALPPGSPCFANRMTLPQRGGCLRVPGPTFLHINRAWVQPRPRVIHSPRAHETDRRSLHARKAYFPRLCCLRSARALSFPALLFCLDYRKDWLRGWSCSIILLKLAHTR